MNLKSFGSVAIGNLLIFSLIFLVSSCENKKNPLFVGTWQYIESINSDDIVYNTVRTIVLTKNSYEETFSVRRENSPSFTEILGKKGALTLTRSGLAFSIKELGTCLRDASDICTGNVEWYGEGSQYWAENISLYQLHFPGNLEADETTLWLSRDMNTDGDTDDAGEEIVFERISP